MLVTLKVYRVKAKLSHESLLGGYTDGSDGLVAVTGFFSKALVRAIRCQCYSFLNSIFLSSSNRLKNQQTETPWLTPWQRIGRICYSRKKETKQCKYREVFFPALLLWRGSNFSQATFVPLNLVWLRAILFRALKTRCCRMQLCVIELLVALAGICYNNPPLIFNSEIG